MGQSLRTLKKLHKHCKILNQLPPKKQNKYLYSLIEIYIVYCSFHSLGTFGVLHIFST